MSKKLETLKVEIQIDVEWFSTEYLETLLKSKFYSSDEPYTIKVKELKEK